MIKFPNMPKENIIISLGGSLVAPGEIDVAFLRVFKKAILKNTTSQRFFIFVGGGKICRNYQHALLEFGADINERDVMGVDVSRLNARVVQQLFGEAAHSQIITNPTKKISTNKYIIVAAGWKPGWSTDYCAVTLAKNMGIKTIVNLRGKSEIGSTFVTVLQRYGEALKDHQSKLMLVGVDPVVRDQLAKTGVLKDIGEENVFVATPQLGAALNQAVAAATAWLAQSPRSASGVG